MKRSLVFLVLAFSVVFAASANDYKEYLRRGTPEIASMNSIAFNDDGVLFVGDSKSAKIVAVDLEEAKTSKVISVNVDNLDRKIAALLGATADGIRINDMAVNPVSQYIDVAVTAPNETPVLIRVNTSAEVSVVDLGDVLFSELAIKNPVAADKKDRRGRPLRRNVITDVQVAGGKVMVTGLSSEEFASTFWHAPFPFKGNSEAASLEVYHGAHGRFETYAPVRTFIPYSLNGEEHLLAAYT